MGEAKSNIVALQAATRPKCKTCPHFTAAGDNSSNHHCRRYPPVPMQVTQQIPPQIVDATKMPPVMSPPQMAMVLKSYWPPIGEQGWCGEHPEFGLWYGKHLATFQQVDKLDRVESAGNG